MNDPIDDFLGADLNLPPPRELRQSILLETTCAIRRRRWTRRLAQAGAMAACFVAGMAAMSFVSRHSNVDIANGRPEDHQPPAKTAVVAQDGHHLNGEVEPTLTEPTLLELEWRAFDSKENRAALYFAVANRYLEERQDYEAALRCYRQALDAAGPEELAVRPDDNWFVSSLKEARLQEKSDASISP
jgi:tetratricopeptide (TPR) repeat protein